jgi:uncharacterized protein DUF6515
MNERTMSQMKSTNSRRLGKSENTCGRSKTLLGATLLGGLLLSSMCVAMAQVYGVRRTAVVHGPNTTVVAGKNTVVAGGAVLPHGYIAVLPNGYKTVTVAGVRYYTVGGVYYRPKIYEGRTVYVVAHV